MTTLSSEDSVPSAGHQPGLLSLAGDALCLAVAALRLSPAPASEAASSATLPPPRSPIAPRASAARKPAPVAKDDAVLPEVSLAEVAWHDHIDDCWVVVYDRVYDLTHFLYQHPGGEDVLLDYAGRDATLAFAGIGHGPAMQLAMRPYAVGRLPQAECIYSVAAAERGVLQLLGLS